ncbi:MAG: glutaredoxin family protein [Actinobacteria bacterium]|nr:glutaredoxin family protein [Actinomycetota bacterium]
MNTPSTRTDTIEVILVEADACHLCEDAKSALEAMAAEHRLQLRRVDLSSVEGRAIMRSTRAPMPPIVIIDGELLGWGRLSRGKLRRRLEQLEQRGSR